MNSALGSGYSRSKFAVGEKSGMKDSQRFVFASPKFQPKQERRLKTFDESAPDLDSATVVSVVDSFNPYTSLESGSYCGTSASSNDSNVDEVVNMVGNMDVIESSPSMPYIS
jgi:hypothetical protein